MTGADSLGSKRPSIGRALVLIGAFILLFAAATGAVRWMQFAYAHPTIDEYLAHIDGKGRVVPAGQLSFDGHDFTCGRFPTLMDATLDDYGAAYFGFIMLNPDRFVKMPLTLKRYAYAHECGHQYVGYNEADADCYAVRRGLRKGWLDDAAMNEICGFIGRSKGDDAHALGTRRCDLMRRCIAQNRPGREMH